VRPGRRLESTSAILEGRHTPIRAGNAVNVPGLGPGEGEGSSVRVSQARQVLIGVVGGRHPSPAGVLHKAELAVGAEERDSPIVFGQEEKRTESGQYVIAPVDRVES